MDCDVAGYKQSRYDEIANEMKNMLVKVGWKKEFIEKNTPVLPISGWMGDNLLKKSENMAWWKGMDVEVGKETIHTIGRRKKNKTTTTTNKQTIALKLSPLPPVGKFIVKTIYFYLP